MPTSRACATKPSHSGSAEPGGPTKRPRSGRGDSTAGRQLSLRDGDAAAQTTQEISRLLRKRRHIAPAEDDDFSVRDLKGIAIRLAVGARAQEVLIQFLVEAIVLSAFGGMIGVIVALLGSLGLSRLLQVPFVFDPSIVLIDFVFSAVVRVLFGHFPARRAARLDPIDALRHE